MDQEHIIEQLLDRCKLLIEGILRDPSRPSVAAHPLPSSSSSARWCGSR
jgi:hypothetical protein